MRLNCETMMMIGERVSSNKKKSVRHRWTPFAIHIICNLQFAIGNRIRISWVSVILVSLSLSFSLTHTSHDYYIAYMGEKNKNEL